MSWENRCIQCHKLLSLFESGKVFRTPHLCQHLTNMSIVGYNEKV